VQWSPRVEKKELGLQGVPGHSLKERGNWESAA
jgi:hypothetical protein